MRASHTHTAHTFANVRQRRRSAVRRRLPNKHEAQQRGTEARTDDRRDTLTDALVSDAAMAMAFLLCCAFIRTMNTRALVGWDGNDGADSFRALRVRMRVRCVVVVRMCVWFCFLPAHVSRCCVLKCKVLTKTVESRR